jgi:pyridoxamine 5'-phosphate oxidase
MSLAPWRSPLARALHRNRSLAYARYLQLATVRADGRPANRTIVFRGFRDGTNQLQFATDSRSDKATQIRHQPWGEACWYFPQTREQFRLAGSLDLIGADGADAELHQARQKLWQGLSAAARIQFAWAHPSQPRATNEVFYPPVPDATEPLLNFQMLILEPEQVDHLELRGDPQNRCRYVQNGNRQWSVQDVNP